jgi:hypothetical protein
MAPHLVRWEEQWKDAGLKVVEIEYGQATPLEALQAHLESDDVRHAVCYDATGEISSRFDVHGFPTALIVSKAGKVVWHGYPGQDVKGVEAALRRALGK